MRITFDVAKREATLHEQGLDFADASEVLAGMTLDQADTRKEYGEPRVVTFGHLRDRPAAIV